MPLGDKGGRKQKKAEHAAKKKKILKERGEKAMVVWSESEQIRESYSTLGKDSKGGGAIN